MKFTVQSSFFQAFMRGKIARMNDFPRMGAHFSKLSCEEKQQNTRYSPYEAHFPQARMQGNFRKQKKSPSKPLFSRILSENRPLLAPNFKIAIHGSPTCE
ncbi:MAG: hypothetical protein IJ773_06785 [Lachnospiraceae bacterium]|nr:hypothetical protein [Lachnospiraceae bacterium]